MRHKFNMINRILELYQIGGFWQVVRGASDYMLYDIVGIERRQMGKHRRLLDDKENLHIAEIGVFAGKHSKSMLDRWSVEELYLIDPYFDFEKEKEKAYDLLGSGDDTITWIHKESHEAVEDIDSNLDYIYIDGNHNYEFVKKDLEIYYPLVKSGGILAGHDIDHDGVSRALAEFCVENEIQPNIEGETDDWYLLKNKYD